MTIYRVSAGQVPPTDPLHVGHFYPDLERRHRRMMQDRQDLILYLAHIHAAAVQSGKPLGFCRVPMRLMTLRDWVYDYRTVFDHFFTVVQTGFNVGDRHEISIVIPKKLPTEIMKAETERKMTYQPPPLPKDGVVSKVYVRQERREAILEKLAESGRLDLHAPVEWLLTQRSNEINFYFTPAGKLKQRDTSTWPIQAIETWPSWLREELFGQGVDIESAYTQYLIEAVRGVYPGQEEAFRSLFPDLLRSLEDKAAWRRELCCDVLGLEWNDQNLALVKKICMSLANGSRISASILSSNMGFSVTKDIIVETVEDITATNLNRIGLRLEKISRQYASARKLACIALGMHPSRKNQKQVFSSYFEWERVARYKIWEAVGRHGIMVHDGIDGIPAEYLTDIPALIKSLNIRITT